MSNAPSDVRPPAADLVGVPLADARQAFLDWMVEHADVLAPFRTPDHEVAATFATLSRLQRMLFDAGWIRLGWPVELGGLGGSLILRAMAKEATFWQNMEVNPTRSSSAMAYLAIRRSISDPKPLRFRSTCCDLLTASGDSAGKHRWKYSSTSTVK